MMTMKWYAHGQYSCEGQIQEELERTRNERFMADSAIPTLAQELYNYFYEVEFDIEVNEFTGKITKISLAPKQRYEIKEVRK